MKVLVLSMSPERDWYIDEQICRELQKLGHKTFLRNYLQDGRTAVIFEKPDVAVIPVVRCPYTRDFAKRIHSWGIKVAARRSEAGVSTAMYYRMPRHLQVNQIGRYDYDDFVDMELVWGKEFADILVRENKIRKDKIRLIGGIALDTYKLPDYGEKIAKLAGTKEAFFEKNNLDPNKPTIFWACGFKMADVNPDYTLPEAEFGDPIHRELYEKDKDGRKHWIEAINKLYSRYSDKYNFFVRPHPGEVCLKYRQRLSVGIAISLEGSAAIGLVHSDILIHAGSTLAVDAHMLNKPAYSFYKAAEDDLIGNVSPRCDTPEELADMIDNVVFGKSNSLITSINDLESFYGIIDGHACERTALAVNEFAECEIQTNIPDYWPEEELNDYTTEGVIKLSNLPIQYCNVCKKPFQLLNGQKQVPCPHCSIATRINSFVCT